MGSYDSYLGPTGTGQLSDSGRPSMAYVYPQGEGWADSKGTEIVSLLSAEQGRFGLAGTYMVSRIWVWSREGPYPLRLHMLEGASGFCRANPRRKTLGLFGC